jgi:hypothetical protein
MLDASAFATAVVDRLAEPDSALFTLLLVRPQNKRGETLGEVLLQTIRSEMGDFVGRTEDGYGVLLQGADRARRVRSSAV